VSLRGSVLLAGGCDLTLLNTTDIKKSRTVSVLCSSGHIAVLYVTAVDVCPQGSFEVAAASFSHGCFPGIREVADESRAVSPLWLDVTPRYQRCAVCLSVTRFSLFTVELCLSLAQRFAVAAPRGGVCVCRIQPVPWLSSGGRWR
jgi:hypothetical protein